jgi:ABC-type transport system involved in multi-copper enzyme maturation permease subunit
VAADQRGRRSPRALLAGELRRVQARRLVRVVFALVALGIVIGGVATFFKTHQLSEATYQARLRAAEASAAIQFNGPAGVGLCPPGATEEPVKVRPGNNPQPSCIPVDVVVHDPRLHLTSLKGVLEGVTAPLSILACLIGASVIGAEWPSRTITTILTWEPRRHRVLAAKIVAAIATSVVLALAGLVFLSLALLPSAFLHGTTAGADGAWWWSSAGVVLRALGMVAISATIGFSIASAGRNTAAALAALFAYVVVIERLVAGLITGWQRWLLIGNAAIFVSGRPAALSGVHERSVAVAGVYLAAVAVGLYAIAAAVFQRRDVA